MYCKQCGNKLEDTDIYCPFCGNKLNEESKTIQPLLNDQPNLLINILCFLIPPLALFLFLVWIKTFPKKAKSCAIWGLIGFFGSYILRILIIIGYMF